VGWRRRWPASEVSLGSASREGVSGAHSFGRLGLGDPGVNGLASGAADPSRSGAPQNEALQQTRSAFATGAAALAAERRCSADLIWAATA